MYQLVKHLGVGAFVAREAGPLAVSMVIAEAFYKFHSFTLETLAFLPTWYLVSRATDALIMRWSGK